MNILLKNSGLFSATEIAVPLPPHGEAAIGRAEDAAQNCLRLRPRAPRKDLNKFLQYSGKVSGLSLKMISFFIGYVISASCYLRLGFPCMSDNRKEGFF